MSLDFTKCASCEDPNASLENYYGAALCSDCINLEKDTDWDQYEEDKRRRIAEENEE